MRTITAAVVALALSRCTGSVVNPRPPERYVYYWRASWSPEQVREAAAPCGEKLKHDRDVAKVIGVVDAVLWAPFQIVNAGVAEATAAERQYFVCLQQHGIFVRREADGPPARRHSAAHARDQWRPAAALAGAGVAEDAT